MHRWRRIILPAIFGSLIGALTSIARSDAKAIWFDLERAGGIEPPSSVWKTEVLTITQRPRPTGPVNHPRWEVKKYVSSFVRYRRNRSINGSYWRALTAVTNEKRAFKRSTTMEGFRNQSVDQIRSMFHPKFSRTAWRTLSRSRVAGIQAHRSIG